MGISFEREKDTQPYIQKQRLKKVHQLF